MTEEQLIERVAQIIDHDAWHPFLKADGCGAWWMTRRAKATDQARDILAVIREREGWQTIDTAPKDGTCVDLYRPDRIGGGGRVCVGHYNNDMYARKGPRPFWETQYGGLGRIHDRDNPPSHWRPRPAPPKTEGEG